MAYLELVVGQWEITECSPETAVKGKKSIIGAVFELSKLGQVRWNIPEGTVDVPLLICDTYEIVTRGQFISATILRFGTYQGHILEFQFDVFNMDDGVMVLRKGWCRIQCKRIGFCTVELTKPGFSLLPALEDGYFSDLNIISDNNRIFKTHTCILKMSAPDLDWTAEPPPFSGLPEDVLGSTLHYLYAECLPERLPSRTAESVISHLESFPEMQKLRKLCISYVHHLTLQNQITDVLGEVNSCASRMTENFSGRNVRSEPMKLCLAIKRAARDVAVANAKLLLLTDMYSKRKMELTPLADQEVIRFIQSRGPVVLGQVKSCLLGVSSALTSLQVPQRQDLSSYLVPEVESMLETATSILLKVKSVVNAMLKQGLKVEEEPVDEAVSTWEQTLNIALQQKELVRLRCIESRISCIRKQLLQRKEAFRFLSAGNKTRSLSRNLEQLIEELPVFLLRLEEVTGALDLKFEWTVSQFCFKVGTAKVCEVLRKLVLEKDNIQDLMVQLCQLVERDAFSQCLVTLGLLDVAAVPTNHLSDQKTDQATSTQGGKTLNLTESFSMPPTAKRSNLAAASADLLERGIDTDMVFEVVEPNCVTTLAAHRVIVAARCNWFRRALLSGMQEDIQRRIEVHDSNSHLFSNFLQYLYTSRLATDSLSGDQLAELLLLGDRYEVDDLKAACEEALIPHIEDESVLDLLVISDQFNALTLKHSCVQFASEHPSVLDSDAFSELSCNLQVEVYDSIERPAVSRRKTNPPPIVSAADIGSTEELELAVERLQFIVGDVIPRSRIERVLQASNMDLSKALNLLYYRSS